jgi:ferredoxin
MASPSTVYTAGDFIRRVVDSLLHGECRGQFLCARCLVRLTKDNLDRSYAKPDVARVMDDIFATPGSLTLAPASLCALCARKKVSCLGASASR